MSPLHQPVQLAKSLATLDQLSRGRVEIGFGAGDACVRGLREVADAGAGMILLTALFDHAAQMERLAEEVLPHLP